MSCLSCASGHQAEFSAEMIVHVGGPKNLDNPGTWIFTKLSICLDCGCARFTVPEIELALLAAGAPKSERPAQAAGA
jgi:hypothetical protein